MTTDYWRNQISLVILNTGDMIVDVLTGHYGLLIERVKKMLDMKLNLIYTSGE